MKFYKIKEFNSPPLDYPIKRVKLIRGDNKDVSRKSEVIRVSDGNLLGYINSDRADISFKEITKFISEEFSRLGFGYKLINSQISESGDLYQEYVFDSQVVTPDHDKAYMMAIVKSSYVNKPLEIYFGIYWDDDQKVTVSQSLSKAYIKSEVSEDSWKKSLGDIYSRFYLSYKVAEKYLVLSDQIINYDVLYKVLRDKYLGSMIKKDLLFSLKKDDILVIDWKKNKIRLSDLKDPSHLFTLNKEITLWGLYRRLIKCTTVRSDLINIRLKNYERISKLFEV